MTGAADALLVETIEQLLSDISTPAEVEHAETDGGWSSRTWAALSAAGFPWVGIEESRGGSGGTLADTAALLHAAGRFSVSAPLAETAMVAGWLLAASDLPLPDGPLSAISEPAVVDGGRLRVDGIAAWGRQAQQLVAATADGHVVALDPDQVTVSRGANLAGEARDRITAELRLDDVDHGRVPGAYDRLLDRGATSRAIMAAGALDAIATMTIDYTHARHQFGRPVARFQAVQQHLVVVTQSAVRARMAADTAVRSLAAGSVGIDVAAARVVIDDAIALGTEAAHQAHGAMGVTREYPLHQSTRRLWSWRHEWGTTRHWRRSLGRSVVDAGPDRLFALITG